MAELIELSTTWGRAPLPANAPQLGYVLLEAQVASQGHQSHAPVTFCMVLDRSGSMDGPKIQHLKQAVIDMIADLQADDQVAIIVFDETAQIVIPLQPAGDKVALNNRVEAIRVQGGTAMSSGLEIAANELQRAAANVQLLLLTDGQTWGDEDRCRQLADQLAQQGVRITALGLGDEWNQGLLDDLAQATGGTSDYVARPQDLVPSFRRVAETAHSTVARNARLLVRLADGVQPRAVYRVTPQIANLGYTPVTDRDVNIHLGDIATSSGASVLLELALPALDAGEQLMAQVDLSFELSQDGTSQQYQSDMLLPVTGDANAVQVVPRVMNIVEKVTAFKLQTRALDEAAAGNLVGATQTLRATATRLLNLGEDDLAGTMERAADALAQGEEPSAADQKEMTYSTRRLSMKDLQTGQ